MVEFSYLLRTKRQEKGLSIRGLERLLTEQAIGNTISRTLIGYLESGDRVPTYDVAYSIAQVLEIDTTQAMVAAYVSRSKHSAKREAKYLEEFTKKKGLGWDPDHIITKARRSLTL